MSAASKFFRLCRQRQFPSSRAASIRQATRKPVRYQTRNFTSFRHFYAQPTDAAAQSGPQAEHPILSTRTPEATSSNTANTSLFCGNLAWGVKRETVMYAFSKHGNVTGIRLHQKLEKRNDERRGWGGYNGGFCFVTFATAEEAAAAQKAMNGADIDGRVVDVRFEQGISARDQEYVRSQPLVTGTVSRTGTMSKTVSVTTKRRYLDKLTKTHHFKEESVLVHDPQNILAEGDVIKYQHFPLDVYEVRKARGKKQVRFVLKEIVTPFGKPIEERTPSPQELPTAEDGNRQRVQSNRKPQGAEATAALPS